MSPSVKCATGESNLPKTFTAVELSGLSMEDVSLVPRDEGLPNCFLFRSSRGVVDVKIGRGCFFGCPRPRLGAAG